MERHPSVGHFPPGDRKLCAKRSIPVRGGCILWAAVAAAEAAAAAAFALACTRAFALSGRGGLCC